MGKEITLTKEMLGQMAETMATRTAEAVKIVMDRKTAPLIARIGQLEEDVKTLRALLGKKLESFSDAQR